MHRILIRDLDPATVERLKQRARRHGRSLQKEAKAILEEAANRLSVEEARRVAEDWHRRLAGREFSDSADLIREDRDG
jgi:plasmid stability protein